MIDDMEGLFTHASEAFQAGKVSGRDELFRTIQAVLGKISVKYESEAVSGPGKPLATRGFHVAQECAKAVRETRDMLDTRRRTF